MRVISALQRLLIGHVQNLGAILHAGGSDIFFDDANRLGRLIDKHGTRRAAAQRLNAHLTGSRKQIQHRRVIQPKL